MVIRSFSIFENPAVGRSSADERGSVSLLGALLVFVLLGMGLGLNLLYSKFREQVRIQSELDFCVQQYATEISIFLRQIETTNFQMKVIRGMLIPAHLLPPAKKMLDALLTLEFFYQEKIRMQWQINRALWPIQKGCKAKGGKGLPYPEFPYRRNRSDLIGKTPLEALGLLKTYEETGAKIENWVGHRHSAALISKVSRKREMHANQWNAQWTTPSLEITNLIPSVD
jgi:hypothetical protein